MIRLLLTPIMRPIARRKLARLNAEHKHITAAIKRAKRDHRPVRYLHDQRIRNQIDRLKWGRWLPQAKADPIFRTANQMEI